ncbi:MAG: hypothetical protein IT318_08625 [Anaerolineales bacterium]|nr:hypothetical protein [Anaerolineales bacterium]
MLGDSDITDAISESVGDKIVRLIREVARLKRLISEAIATLSALKSGDLARLMLQFDEAQSRGLDGLADLILTIEWQIHEAKSEWSRLRAEETELWKAID